MIKQPYSLEEIKAKIASNDYNAELLLQHAMILLGDYVAQTTWQSSTGQKLQKIAEIKLEEVLDEVTKQAKIRASEVNSNNATKEKKEQIMNIYQQNYKTVNFESVIGLTFKSVEINYAKDQILFTSTDERKFMMYHRQGCCESVTVNDVTGDTEDLIGYPILLAEEATNRDTNPEGVPVLKYQDSSFTWTFYKLATIKGYVDIRWYGESNGYYSESVDFVEIFEYKE